MALERISRVAKPLGKLFAPRLVANMQLPVRRIRRRAGHDYFHDAFLISLVVPMRAKVDDFAIQVDADAPAHADDHRLAFILGLAEHRFRPRFEVIDDVLSDELDTLPSADHGFELRPLGLELFFPVDFFALGRFLKLRIDLRALRFIEVELG